MNVNVPVVILVIIAAFALLIWMVRRDQHDKHRFEKELIDEENQSQPDKINKGGKERF